MTAPQTATTETSTFDFKVELKAVLRLGWPIVLTQLFIMLTGTVDAAMAGHYSSVDLAGVSLGGMIMWPFFMLLTGLTMALTPIAAQLRGAGRPREIGHQIRQGLWICVITSTLLVILMVSTDVIYTWVGVAEPEREIAVAYLRAAAWGAPAVVFYVALRHICEGLGHTRPPMVIAGSVIPLNALSNYGFVYGNFGLPELGGVGCGYATAIIFWVELGLMLIVCKQPYFKAIEAFNRFEAPSITTIMAILRVGTPIGLTIFVEMAVFSVVGLAIARFGALELAANSIAGNLNWATYVIPAAIGSAASIRVGFYVGAGNYAAARATSGVVWKFSLAYALVVGVLLILLRYHLISIFTTDTPVVEIAATLVLFIAVYQLVDDSNAVAIGALRGYKDTFVPMLAGLIGYWFIAVPLGYGLAEGHLLPGLAPGVYGYWAALTIGLAIVSVCMGLRLWHISGNHEKISRMAR